MAAPVSVKDESKHIVSLGNYITALSLVECVYAITVIHLLVFGQTISSWGQCSTTCEIEIVSSDGK